MRCVSRKLLAPLATKPIARCLLNSCYVWYLGLNDGPAARRPLHGLYSTSQVRKDVCIVVLVDLLVSLYILFINARSCQGCQQHVLL